MYKSINIWILIFGLVFSQTLHPTILPEKVRHRFSKWTEFIPPWDQAYNSIPVQNNKATATENKLIDYKNIKDLPYILTEAKIENSAAPMVFYISGDGGWYSFEQKLCDYFADAGIPTVGLDAKKYFRNRHTPKESAKDAAQLLNYFSGLWHKEKILLIGYSMGAEVMPFIYEYLPEGLQKKVEKIILLSPEEKADFEVHITNMLDLGSFENTYNVLEEIKKINLLTSILVITGNSEDSSLPAELSGTKVNFATVPGNHRLNHDSKVIFDVISQRAIIK